MLGTSSAIPLAVICDSGSGVVVVLRANNKLTLLEQHGEYHRSRSLVYKTEISLRSEIHKKPHRSTNKPSAAVITFSFSPLFDFQVNPSRAAHSAADLSFMAVSCSGEQGENSRAESLRGREGVYTRKTSLLPLPMVHLPEDNEDSPETPPLKSGPFQTMPKGCTASSSSSSAAPSKVPLKHVSKTMRKDQEEEHAPPPPWRNEGKPATDGSQTDLHRAGPRKLSLRPPMEEAASGSRPTGKGATDQRIENPYSAMHAVICVSDEEEEDEDYSA